MLPWPVYIEEGLEASAIGLGCITAGTATGVTLSE